MNFVTVILQIGREIARVSGINAGRDPCRQDARRETESHPVNRVYETRN